MPFPLDDIGTLENSGETVEFLSDTVCIGCGYRHDPAGPTREFYSLTRGPVCSDCYAVCPDCDKPFNLNSGWTHAMNNDYVAVCNRCTNANYIFCSSCDEWESDDRSVYSNILDRWFCGDCREGSLAFCDNCSEYTWEDDFDHFNECGVSSLIHDYSFRPAPIFNHTDEDISQAKTILQDTGRITRKYRQIAYMGFELEVECTGDRSDCNGGARLFEDNRHLYLKTDSSLNFGFEIVSHPMTLRYAMERFNWDPIKQLGEHDFSAWYTDTAGLHIHVSRDGFKSESHQARFIHLFLRNATFFEWVAGRKEERWASFNPEMMKDIRSKIKRNRGTDRYSAVNLNNSQTLEVRIFQASLKVERIQMCMQLVDAAVKYTDNMSVNDMVSGNSIGANAFIKWLKDKPEYEILYTYVNPWLNSQSQPEIGE